MVIMMEEDNSIFFAVGDALVYLAEPIHKKYSTISIWGYPFSMYVSYDRFFNPLPLYAPVHILYDHFPIPPVALVLNGQPISQPKKQIRTFGRDFSKPCCGKELSKHLCEA